MFTHSPTTDGVPSPHIEKLLEAANDASQTVAVVHVAFIAFAAYIGVIVWGTTHEDLLRISPVKLPILDVELPLTTFYSFVPWLVVLLHFNLLMQLELLSRKLWNLDCSLPSTPAGQKVRDRLFIFPFTHFIAGRSSVWLIRWMLSLAVGLTVIALPLFILLAAQVRFLPFHDEVITWSQRVAVWMDLLLLITLWPLIASAKDSPREWWRNLGYRILGYWLSWIRYLGVNEWNRLIGLIERRWVTPYCLQRVPHMPKIGGEAKGMIVLIASVSLVLLLSIIAVIPGSITVHNYYNPLKYPLEENEPVYFEDWLIRHAPEKWLSVADDESLCAGILPAMAEKSQIIMLNLTCNWFDFGVFQRNLDLSAIRLVPKEVSFALMTRAIDQDKALRENAFKEFDGLNLQERDLRFANFRRAVLPKTNFSNARLQGAYLNVADMQGANFYMANLQGADLRFANLQGAKLGGAKLQGAELYMAHLEGSDLNGAELQNVQMNWAHMRGADLIGANLKGANMDKTELQGANLFGAKLQGATLVNANLQGANLDNTDLQDADLHLANLQDVQLRRSKLRGVYWGEANLDRIMIVESLISNSNEYQQGEAEPTLNPLLSESTFADFQQQIELARKGWVSGEPSSQISCYSDNPALLKCKYHNPAQLDAYHAALHPALIKLACSDSTVAEGIAIRSFSQTISDAYPDFDLAASLLKELEIPNPCASLASLSEQTRQLLQRTAAEK
jgi:uncharacterized protein YjbI with pentapeptide repeats